MLKWSDEEEEGSDYTSSSTISSIHTRIDQSTRLIIMMQISVAAWRPRSILLRLYKSPSITSNICWKNS